MMMLAKLIQILGGIGNDIISAGYGDSVDGGIGTDQLYLSCYAGANAGITADFRTLTNGGTLTIAGATLAGIEYVTGLSLTQFDDVVIAGAVESVVGITLDGWGGNDVLTGSSGVDSIYGGDGNDVIYGGVGFNPNIVPSTDRLRGEAGDDTIHIGNDGAEAMGGVGNDAIYGGNAYDEIFGDDGNDLLRGGGGNDGINGGSGNDLLTGGLGQDTIVDNSGDDTFLDTAAGLNGDTIVGFSVGDKIIITDANLSSFAFQLSGNVLTYSGGTLNINSELPGRIVASAAAGGGVQLQVQLPPVGTNDQIASQLTGGYWDGDVHRWNVTQGGTITVNINTLSSAEQAVARTALGLWADIIGVQFQEVSSGGQIVFDNGPGAGAYADTNWSNGIMTSAVIHIPSGWITTYGSLPGSYGFETYVHEVGHALGLGHPGNYNLSASYAGDAIFANDSVATSVMSYFDMSENYYFATQHFSNYRAGTPMQADIVAMQTLYGLATTTRTGNTVYGYNSNAGGVWDATVSGSVALTIFDHGGIDTLDYSNVNWGQLINLNPETFSNVNSGVGNLSIARGTIVENAIGGFGSDTIIGNTTSNVLTGNAGADILTGGSGADTFRDTAAGLNGDTITDFGAGDSIVISNASLAGFSYSLSGSTLTYSGGSLTLTGFTGRLQATTAAGGGVQLTVNDARNDFNGDGRSDILWRNDTGHLAEWLAQPGGTFAYNPNAAYQLDTSWKIIGFGDFNGDGRDDILWEHDNGNHMQWLAQPDGNFAWNPILPEAMQPDWHLQGIGDFNADGRDDMIWRTEAGTITEWLGQANGSFIANPDAQYTLGTNWQVAGVGDFNGDGRDDILWRNEAGAMSEWLGQSGGTFAWNPNAAYQLPANWEVAATGDFNGDGRDDILWRNEVGAMSEWLAQADGTFAWNPNAAYQLPSNWEVATTGDFNGDGRDDIMWRNEVGAMSEWLAQADGTFAWNPNAAYQMPTNWEMQPESPII